MLTHLRIIFPIEADIPNLLRLDRDPNWPILAKVWHKCLHWNEDGVPNYLPDMDIHVGVERKPETSFFGKLEVPPAQGLIRGEYVRFERSVNGTAWGWLTFAPRYDMQEGPEIWAGDWHQTLHGEEPGSALFCYKLEINLESE
jgi:hypothetical protein